MAVRHLRCMIQWLSMLVFAVGLASASVCAADAPAADPVRAFVDEERRIKWDPELLRRRIAAASDPEARDRMIRESIAAIDAAIDATPNSPALREIQEIKMAYLTALDQWDAAEELASDLSDTAPTPTARLEYLIRSLHLRASSSVARSSEYLSVSESRWRTTLAEYHGIAFSDDRVRSAIAKGLIHTANEIARIAYEAGAQPQLAVLVAENLDRANVELSPHLLQSDLEALDSMGRGSSDRFMRSALLYGIAGRTEEATKRLNHLLRNPVSCVSRPRLLELVVAIQRGDPERGAEDALRAMLDSSTDVRERLEARRHLADRCMSDPVEARPMFETLYLDALGEAEFGEAWAVSIALHAARRLAVIVPSQCQQQFIAWHESGNEIAEWSRPRSAQTSQSPSQ